MSYYDPLLAELEQLDQPNYLTQSGQAMSMRGAPINAGGGFWSNLAAQLVPGLLGAGMSYIGQQQNKSSEADLLAAAKLGDSQQVADSLISSGHEGLAARVLMAAKEQEALARAEQAKLNQTMAYESWKMDKDLKGKKILEAMKGARIGANSAANRAATLEAAQMNADAAKMNALLGAAQNTEFKLDAEARANPNVKAYDESLYLADTLKRLGNRETLSGLDVIGAQKTLSQLIRQEAINKGDIADIEAAGGLDNYVEKQTAYIFNKGQRDPNVLKPYVALASDLVEARKAQAELAIGETRRRAAEYGKLNPYLSPARVGPELAPNPLAAKIAEAIQQGPQPVQMPKATPTIVESKTVNGVTYNKYSDGRISKVGG